MEKLYVYSYEEIKGVFERIENDDITDLENAEMTYYTEESLYENFNCELKKDCIILHGENGVIAFEENEEIVIDQDSTVFRLFEKGTWLF